MKTTTKLSAALLLLPLVFSCALRATTPEPAEDPTIVLPKFTVSAELDGYEQEADWKYCALPGLEVLGKSVNKNLKNVLREFLLFRKDLDKVWPISLASNQLPAIFVVCDEATDLEKFFLNLKAKQRLLPHNHFIGGASLSQGDQAIVLMRLMSDESRTAAVMGYMYMNAILERSGKHSMPWLTRGLAKTFTLGMTYSKGQFSFPALTTDETLNIRNAGLEEDLDKALQEGKFFTLEQLFSTERLPANEVRAYNIPHDEALSKAFAGPWSNECYEFVHLCLFGADGKYREPFLKLADLASKQPIDEPTFRSLFGMGFREMLLILWRYTDCAKPTKFQIGNEKDKTRAAQPAIEFREATDAEFSRIRGEALLAKKWRGAHFAFIAAYLRGACDPELLASLGIQEALVDKDERALKFLEAAAKARTTRARAYTELARLRCKAAFAKPEGEGGKLSATQLQTVLEPISIAFTFPPSLPLSYQVLTAAWSESAVRPTLEDLSVIRKGVENFPFETDLTYNAAAVHLKYGYSAEAKALAEFGLKMARNKKDRARFADLRASMDPK